MQRRASAFRLFVAAVLVSCVSFGALAQGHFEVGIGASYGNGVTANAHANIPLFEAWDLQHSLRPQVTYAFTGVPAISATYLLTGKPEGEDLERYLGAGIGVAFASAPFGGLVVSYHGLAGVNIPITSYVQVFTEVSVSGNELGAGVAFGAGVRYVFGGSD